MARGFSTSGDIVRNTIDGVDFSTIWAEFEETIRLRNRDRDSLRAMLSFSTTAAGEAVAQTSSLDDFEDASEYGVPKAIRNDLTSLVLGYNLKDRDLAARYTYQFLRDADRSQIEAVHQSALDADNRQIFKSVLGALLNNTARVNPEGLAVKPLWNNDGTVPPDWNGVAFAGSHNHYVVSGSATFDGGDIRDAFQQVAHHGYGSPDVGGRVIVFLNPVQAEQARGFVKGAAATDPFDFIPGPTAPAYLTTETLVGDRPPAQVGAIPIRQRAAERVQPRSQRLRRRGRDVRQQRPEEPDRVQGAPAVGVQRPPSDPGLVIRLPASGLVLHEDVGHRRSPAGRRSGRSGQGRWRLRHPGRVRDGHRLMDATYLATTASLDRHAAAQAWADRQFPENECATNNSRIVTCSLCEAGGVRRRAHPAARHVISTR